MTREELLDLVEKLKEEKEILKDQLNDEIRKNTMWQRAYRMLDVLCRDYVNSETITKEEFLIMLLNVTNVGHFENGYRNRNYKIKSIDIE